MFRKMRRIRQLMTEADCVDMLTKEGTGVLSVTGDDGYPYGVPVNYIYLDGKIYIHGAKAGHKIDAIKKEAKVSFTVIHMDQNVPEKFTTYFKSVILFGKATIVEDDEEKYRAVDCLAKHFSPDESDERRHNAIEEEWAPLAVIRIDIDHMTGKQAIELVK